VRCDLQRKLARGLPLTDEGSHPWGLTYWRRPAASGWSNRIFGAMAATGVLKDRTPAGRWTQGAMDVALLVDAGATQDTVTQLIAAIRQAGQQVPGHDYSDPGKPDIAWDDDEVEQRLVSA
jgi:hypothetical protein